MLAGETVRGCAGDTCVLPGYTCPRPARTGSATDAPQQPAWTRERNWQECAEQPVRAGRDPAAIFSSRKISGRSRRRGHSKQCNVVPASESTLNTIETGVWQSVSDVTGLRREAGGEYLGCGVGARAGDATP